MSASDTQGFVVLKNPEFNSVDLGVNRGDFRPLLLVADNTHNACMSANTARKPKFQPTPTMRHKNQVEGEQQKARVDVYMSADLKAQLKELARKNRRSMSLYMNEVIRPILERAIQDELSKVK